MRNRQPKSNATVSRPPSEAAEADAIFQAELEEVQKHYEDLVEAFNAKVDQLRDESNYKFAAAILLEKEKEQQEKVEL